ncbi:MAG TPA: hypothetical protein IAB83_10900 [Candidatus Faecousia faecavium]|nr:hypothetical protein [Candidatus Faecousia faecavium]
MSNFTGVTFANQHFSPADDAMVRRAILPDGILTGCDFAYSGFSLTMTEGYLILCGRQIKHTETQNWDLSGKNFGFARLVLTIDLSRTSTQTEFDQVVDTVEYADTLAAFPDLVQEDINIGGTKYQVVACIASLNSSAISGIIDPMEKISG